MKEHGNTIRRPSSYTDEIAGEICDRMVEGESLLRICKDEHIPAESNSSFRDKSMLTSGQSWGFIQGVTGV